MRGKGVETPGVVALIVILGLIFGMGAAPWLAENLYQSTAAFFYWLPSASVAVASAGSLLAACFLAVRLSGGKATPMTMAISPLPLGILAVSLAQREVKTVPAPAL